jgi:undecaprenyl-diphosphatase
LFFWKVQAPNLRDRIMAGPQANLKGVVTTFSAVLAYCVLYVSKADMYIYLYLKPHKKGLFRYVSSFISSLGRGEVLAFLLIVLCLLPVATSKRRGLLWRGILGLVTAGVCSLVIKVLVGRPRPSLLASGYYWPHSPTFVDEFFSTPSGHTVAAFALACVLSFYFPKWRYLLMGTALVIGLSRIFLLYHYPSDIIISALVGCVIGKWASKVKPPRFMEEHIEK